MITIKADTKPLEEAIAEFARLARKDLDDAMVQQGGMLVAHMIALTPPGGRRGEAMNERGGIELEAKRRGESRIAADIARLFPTTRASEGKVRGWIAAGTKVKITKHGRPVEVRDIAFDEGRLAAIHRMARSRSSGRTRVMGGMMTAFTRPALLRAYIRKEQRKVGLLSAGWVPAAAALKTAKRATPAWITRHGSRNGGADIVRQRDRTGIRIYNSQPWFPGDMRRRTELALRRREAGLRKAVEAILERRAKAAERRQARG